MCGTALSPGRETHSEKVIEKVPVTWERAAPAARDTVAEEVRAEQLQRTPLPPPKPTTRVEEPARRSDKWWVEDGDTVEKETTVGGPSFLGLSGDENGGGGGYSYLFEEEKQSHAGAWVMLLVLLALGAVLYWKWQPVRDYVLNAAISHSRPQPKTEAKAEPTSATDSAAPTTTLASSDAPSQPSITTENKPEQNKAASPSSTAKEGLPGGDKQSSGAGKPDDSAKSKAAGASKEPAANAASKQPSSKPAEKGDEASAEQPDDESANAADEEKPSAGTQKARGAQSNPGGDLVSSGERYLYGRGVPRSCDQAVSYFNAAAAKQNPQAFSHLGALYATGNCVPMDRAAAYTWFRRAYAKEPSNHYFEQNLTMLWREMSAAERQRAAGRQ
jgi:hypothetical protein